MKKLILIAICIATSGFLLAQSTQFGLKGGLNMASIKTDDGAEYNSRASLNVGGLAHVHISPHFALQPELEYSGQGAERQGVKIKLGYINVPVLAQYMTGNGFRLETGPQVGFLVSAQNKSNEGTVDVKDNYDVVDVSWAFGASYQFPRSGAGIDARYNLGLNNIYNGSTTVHNRVFSVGMFYQFIK